MERPVEPDILRHVPKYAGAGGIVKAGTQPLALRLVVSTARQRRCRCLPRGAAKSAESVGGRSVQDTFAGNFTGRLLRDAFTRAMPFTCGCPQSGPVPQLRLLGEVSDRAGKPLRNQA
jgi:hypothetical protein